MYKKFFTGQNGQKVEISSVQYVRQSIHQMAWLEAGQKSGVKKHSPATRTVVIIITVCHHTTQVPIGVSRVRINGDLNIQYLHSLPRVGCTYQAHNLQRTHASSKHGDRLRQLLGQRYRYQRFQIHKLSCWGVRVCTARLEQSTHLLCFSDLLEIEQFQIRPGCMVCTGFKVVSQSAMVGFLRETRQTIQNLEQMIPAARR